MNKEVKITIIFSVLLVAVCTLMVFLGNDILVILENDRPSQSIGTTSNGSLINGKRLPTSGPNFHAYSRLAALLGRNTVNNRVRDAVVDAYEKMETTMPDRQFIYGETGWPQGGAFPPHKTHQNGLSVDFMVPVVDEKGKPATLPASVFNKFGYEIEFDERGRYKDISIDFEAIAVHLLELKKSAASNGLSIRIVIFDPTLQKLLFKAPSGVKLKSSLPFSTKPAWVRHDEHYHVDFTLDE